MITDNRHVSKPSDGKKYTKADFLGIANKDLWALKQASELIGMRRPPASDDAFPINTLVEFTAPDGTTYRGKVASKDGDDYIVNTQPGESYLVPPVKLAKVTPDADMVKEAMRREVTPTIRMVAASNVLDRHIVKVAYIGRQPTDEQLKHWASEHFDLELVDAIPRGSQKIDLIFKIAAEDVKPQGTAAEMPGERGKALSSEEIQGTGMIADAIPGGLSEGCKPSDFDPKALEDGVQVEMEHTNDPEIAQEIAMDHLTEDKEYYKKLKNIEACIITFEDVVPQQYTLEETIKEAQLGTPGAGEAYGDLVRAARWVLARFNDSNPKYYAIPEETEVSGEGDNRVARLSFTLNKKTEDDTLTGLYISRQGTIVHEAGPDTKPVRGFVQVDSEGNLPSVMITGPTGPHSIQDYGFNLQASAEMSGFNACMEVADNVLAEHGEYTAAAQADFDARLTKLAVDPTAKQYWQSAFGDYGKKFTSKVPRMLDKKMKQKKASKKIAQEAHHEVDTFAVEYWTNYFGSSAFNDRWYGEQFVRPIIPTRLTKGADKIASDYAAYVKKTPGGKYEVKSESNPDWSGGTYDSKEAAEKRLQQVEFFKHKKSEVEETIEKIAAGQQIDPRIQQFAESIVSLKQRASGVVSGGYGKKFKRGQPDQLAADVLQKVSQTTGVDVNSPQFARQLVVALYKNPKMLNQIQPMLHEYYTKSTGIQPKQDILRTINEKALSPSAWYRGVQQGIGGVQKGLGVLGEQWQKFKNAPSGQFTPQTPGQATLMRASKTAADEPPTTPEKIEVVSEEPETAPEKPVVSPTQSPAPEKKEITTDMLADEESLTEAYVQEYQRLKNDFVSAPIDQRPALDLAVQEAATAMRRQRAKELALNKKYEEQEKAKKPFSKVSPDRPYEAKDLPLPEAATGRPISSEEKKVILSRIDAELASGKYNDEFVSLMHSNERLFRRPKQDGSSYKYPFLSARQIVLIDPAYLILNAPQVYPELAPEFAKLGIAVWTKGILWDLLHPRKRPRTHDEKVKEEAQKLVDARDRAKAREYKEKVEALPWRTPEQMLKLEKEMESKGKEPSAPPEEYGIITPEIRQQWKEQEEEQALKQEYKRPSSEPRLELGKRHRELDRQLKMTESMMEREGLPRNEIEEALKKIRKQHPELYESTRALPEEKVREKVEKKVTTEERQQKIKEMMERSKDILNWRIPSTGEGASKDMGGMTLKEALQAQEGKGSLAKPKFNREQIANFMAQNHPEMWLKYIEVVAAADAETKFINEEDKKEHVRAILTKEHKRIRDIEFMEKPKKREPKETEEMGTAEYKDMISHATYDWKIPSGPFAGKTISSIMSKDPTMEESRDADWNRMKAIKWLLGHNYNPENKEFSGNEFKYYLEGIGADKARELKTKFIDIASKLPWAAIEVLEGMGITTVPRNLLALNKTLKSALEEAERSGNNAAAEIIRPALAELTPSTEAVGKASASMNKKSDAGPKPFAYNVPDKDDDEDYNHKKHNMQPARTRTRFKVTRLYSTSSSQDAGYAIMELAWDPEKFENMSTQNIQHQIVSYVKGLESTKEPHDFGIMGRPRITEMDRDAGVAQIKVRCSNTRGLITLNYTDDSHDVQLNPLCMLR